jgi:hypothetical protein
MAKTIVLLSDGTGNSSAAPFKTNVWRLYNYLALNDEDQIAFYDNGVGSASNLVSRVLGGAFGYGLKRNVLDLYGYLCKAYSDGADIYGFGFSRGAFTIRMTMGLVLRYGLVHYAGDDVAFERQIKSVFRANRVRLASMPGTNGKSASPVPIRWLMKSWNRLMDGWDQMMGHKSAPFQPVGRIRFIGVWDTVDAYGMPIEELRSGFDKFFFPMTFRDHALRCEVEFARHALSLDDERATFHPVLWDEQGEEQTPGRIRQLWFAGAHADVGGGYPDDRLAHVPLLWMMEEAQAAGLRLRSTALADVRSIADHHAPAHDSRKGLGLYYRYKPRRALRSHGDMQNPVRVHPSVIARATHPGISYAPVSIHGAATSDDETLAPLNRHPAMLGRALDYVWWRRLSYFIALAFSLLLAVSPQKTLTLESRFSQTLGSSVDMVDQILDGTARTFADIADKLAPVAKPWSQVLRDHPAYLLLLAGLILLIWHWSARLDGRIQHNALAAHGLVPPPRQPMWFTRAGLRLARVLRTNRLALWGYQKIFKEFVPLVFSLGVLAMILGGLATVINRISFNVQDTKLEDCTPGTDLAKNRSCLTRTADIKLRRGEAVSRIVAVDRLYADTGLAMQPGQRYRLSLRPLHQLQDGKILLPRGALRYDEARPASKSFVEAANARWMRYDWLEPIAQIVEPVGATSRKGAHVRLSGGGSLIAPRRPSRLYIYLNDAVQAPWLGQIFVDRLGAATDQPDYADNQMRSTRSPPRSAMLLITIERLR